MSGWRVFHKDRFSAIQRHAGKKKAGAEAERFRRLTLTSHNAKILHADRKPEGDSRSDRQAQRMGRFAERMVQDCEERRLEELCRGSEQLEEFGRCGALCCVRCKPQQVQADRDHQIQVENDLYPSDSESRGIR